MKSVLIATAILLALAVTACSALPGGAPPPTETTAPTNTPAPTAISTPTLPPPPTALPTLPPPPTKAGTAAPTVKGATATATAKGTAATPAAKTTSVATPANPLTALQGIFKSWSTLKTFRAKITTIGLPTNVAPTGTQVMTMEVVMPDRFHVSAPQAEMIFIGKDIYFKIGNTWQKMALAQGIDLSSADLSKYQALLGANSQVKFIGAEVLNGVPTVVYQYNTTVQGQTSTSKVWISVADNLPRQVESETKPGQKTTVVFSDFNAPITINAPI